MDDDNIANTTTNSTERQSILIRADSHAAGLNRQQSADWPIHQSSTIYRTNSAMLNGYKTESFMPTLHALEIYSSMLLDKLQRVSVIVSLIPAENQKR
jgi:hypothetical protein